MKKSISISITILLVSLFYFKGYAQEKYGSTLNLGLGVGGYSGYYKYAGRSLPVFHINYEFDVAKNFTLAPSINLSTFSDDYYWGDKNTPYRYYSYQETAIPIGVKGTYYFDDLLEADSKWDFYLAGSLGFVLVDSRWGDGYMGDRNFYHAGSPLFLNFHIGTEYHFSKKVGAFLDLSNGISTLGLAIHAIK